MKRRIELVQAARAIADADSRPKPRGNLVVYVPASVGCSHYYGERGRVVQARVTEDKQIVLDLFPAEFRSLLGDRHHGLAWQNCNPEAVRALGQT
jgi:hypothetical protein